MILGMLKTRSLKSVLVGISKEFGKVSEEQLGDQFDALMADSPETGAAAQGASAPGTENDAMAPPAMGRGSPGPVHSGHDRRGAQRRHGPYRGAG